MRPAFFLAVLVVLGWWFFVGESPIALARNFVGRGKRLTSSTLRSDGSLVESVDDLYHQVQTATGRSDVERDDVIVARVIASEDPGGTQRAKIAIGQVLLNDARAQGWSLEKTVTVNPGTLGTQRGRRYSTAGGGKPPTHSREIHEDDLYFAQAVRRGVFANIVGDATNFIHYTGYRRLQDFLLDHPNVQAWIDAGKRPVYLGGVGSLVIFVSPRQLLSETGQPLPEAA